MLDDLGFLAQGRNRPRLGKLYEAAQALYTKPNTTKTMKAMKAMKAMKSKK